MAVVHEAGQGGRGHEPYVEEHMLRILIIEDSVADAELMAATLRRQGTDCAWRRVDTIEALGAALEEDEFDIVLSDFSLPSLTGIEALEAVRRERPELPVIIVSGTIGEERAVEMLRAGVTDYVLKDHLPRLSQAIARAVDQARAASRMSLLSQAATRLLTADFPPPVIEELCERIQHLLRCDVFLHHRLDDSRRELRLSLAAGLPEQALRAVARLSPDQSVCGRIPFRGTRLVLQHIQQHDDEPYLIARSFGIRSWVCHPLRAGERVIGTLGFGSRSRDELDESEIEFLSAFSGYVGAAIGSRLLVDSLREANERLEARVAERTRELEAKAAELDAERERLAALLAAQPGDRSRAGAGARDAEDAG